MGLKDSAASGGSTTASDQLTLRAKLKPLNQNQYSENGLSEEQVLERQSLGLVNLHKTSSSRSLTNILRSNLLTLFNAVVGGAAAVLVAIGQFKDALFGIPVLLNITVGIWQEVRSKRALDRLSVITQNFLQVRRDGKISEIPITEIVVDDLLVIKAGDQIAADALILSSASLTVDESLVSGESEPIVKLAGQELVSGSIVLSGNASARVIRVGAETFAGKMDLEAKRYSLASSEIRKSLNRVIFWISILLIPITLIVGYGQIQAFGGWDKFVSGVTRDQVLVSAIASIVSMVPQGLVLIASIAFAIAAIRLASRNVLTQELPAVETLARVDVICFDKTGTLTTSGIEVNDVQVLQEIQSLHWKNVLAHFANDIDANQTVRALMEKFPVSVKLIESKRIPFESSRRWSGFSFETNLGSTETWVLGAPEVLLADPEHSEFLASAQELAQSGFRVLALAVTTESLTTNESLPRNLQPVVLISLIEQIREESSETLRYFAEQGVSIRIISGDNPLTVAGVAKKAGLQTFGEGNNQTAFDATYLPEDDNDLAALMAQHFVFGRVRPEQKQRMIAALQAKGHTVAMTGDGANDALALKQADLGIAMGNGSSATRAIAKLVLVDGNFASIPQIVAEGRRVIANIERVANLFLTKTAWAIILAVSFGLFTWKFAFVPRQITAMDVFIIGIPSFALALLPNPKRYEPGLLLRALRFSIPVGLALAGAVLALPALLSAVSGNQDVTVAQLQTMVILILSISSLWVVNVLSRPLDLRKSLIVLVCYATFVLIFLVQPVKTFFGFTELSVNQTLWSLLLAVVCCMVVELIHRLSNKKSKSKKLDR